MSAYFTNNNSAKVSVGEGESGLRPKDHNIKQEKTIHKISSKIAQIKEEALDNDNYGLLARPSSSPNMANCFTTTTTTSASAAAAAAVAPRVESGDELKKQKWEPENWLEQLNLIRTMRSEWNAPVDTMGCDSNWDADSSPQVFFELNNDLESGLQTLYSLSLP